MSESPKREEQDREDRDREELAQLEDLDVGAEERDRVSSKDVVGGRTSARDANV